MKLQGLVSSPLEAPVTITVFPVIVAIDLLRLAFEICGNFVVLPISDVIPLVAGQSRARNILVATGRLAYWQCLELNILDSEQLQWCPGNCSMPTVIVGAGIIGLSVAYYLSQSTKDDIHLIEASPQLFSSASGYAAGFLARNWFSPPLAALGELSFDLHKQLAEQHNGYKRWGYRASSSSSLEETVGAGNGADWLREGVSRSTVATRTAKDDGNGPTWLKNCGSLDVMSDGNSTAQIDPLLLCRFLMESCTSRGIHLHRPARLVSVDRRSSPGSLSIEIIDTSTRLKTILLCTNLILAAGAWTPEVFRTLFPHSKVRIPISSLAGHSLVLQSPYWPAPKLDGAEDNNPLVREDCHAIFTTDAEAGYSPEIFSRMPDGHIYLAGLNSSTYPLPKIANERVVDPKSIASLKKTAHKLLGDEFTVVREGVCWRPVAAKGVPIITSLTNNGEQNVYIASGHGPWGISNSLGTGFCVAGMLEGKDMDRYVGRLGL